MSPPAGMTVEQGSPERRKGPGRRGLPGHNGVPGRDLRKQREVTISREQGIHTVRRAYRGAPRVVDHAPDDPGPLREPDWMFVSTAITGLPVHRRSARASPATNGLPTGLDHPDFLHSGRVAGIADVWRRSTARASGRLPPVLAADARSAWSGVLPGSAARRGCPVSSSRLVHSSHTVKDGRAIHTVELVTTRRWSASGELRSRRLRWAVARRATEQRCVLRAERL